MTTNPTNTSTKITVDAGDLLGLMTASYAAHDAVITWRRTNGPVFPLIEALAASHKSSMTLLNSLSDSIEDGNQDNALAVLRASNSDDSDDCISTAETGSEAQR
ncbi:hypothetical protein GCM10009689_17580 [Brevibacterium antiquum]|uniref:hypothetical protein n=1 Tax=Brevibacterium antiquum TaxID=234835 RepID=UPI0018DFA3B2|nr:hypothetical protein [Brevibacterium antiquum]